MKRGTHVPLLSSNDCLEIRRSWIPQLHLPKWPASLIRNQPWEFPWSMAQTIEHLLAPVFSIPRFQAVSTPLPFLPLVSFCAKSNDIDLLDVAFIGRTLMLLEKRF